MIIYGWGRQTRRTLGIVGTTQCSHCNTTSDFHLVQRRTWFTLFFIPVIPYSSKYLVLCSRCEWGWQPTESEVLQLKSTMGMGLAAAAPRPPARPLLSGAIPGVPPRGREEEAIADASPTQLRVGDFVYLNWGSSLTADPSAEGVPAGAADRTGPAIVLATRGSWIQVRDSAGRMGWLQSSSVGSKPS